MPQLLTIGETMAAFTPNAQGPLRYVNGYGIRTAGAESNVAVGLTRTNSVSSSATSFVPRAWIAPM